MPIGEGVHSTNQGRHGYATDGVTVGFFTDPTLCIGCKACEVACKEWNDVPASGSGWSGDSYDNTGALGASSWRHVKFVEEEGRLGLQVTGPMGVGAAATGDAGATGGGAGLGEKAAVGREPAAEDPFRWLFLSDVCKHCETAGCLEACPTGAIVRTPTGAVFIQDDVCNGCGYCVVGCPFGVVDRRSGDGTPGTGAGTAPRERASDGDGGSGGGASPGPGRGGSIPGAGGAFKCTFCWDRQLDGLPPACAKACPTESIQFGPLEELRERARHRVEELEVRGFEDVRVYDPRDTSVGGIHAFFLVPGDPAAFGLPPAPEAPTAYLKESWTAAFATAAVATALVLGAFLMGGVS